MVCTLHSSSAHTRACGPPNVTVPASRSMSLARTAAASAAEPPDCDTATTFDRFDGTAPGSAYAQTLASSSSLRGLACVWGGSRLIFSPAAVAGSTCAPSAAAASNTSSKIHWRLLAVLTDGSRGEPSGPRVPAQHHSSEMSEFTSGHALAPRLSK